MGFLLLHEDEEALFVWRAPSVDNVGRIKLKLYRDVYCQEGLKQTFDICMNTYLHNYLRSLQNRAAIERITQDF